jgi:hypothetical protein
LSPAEADSPIPVNTSSTVPASHRRASPASLLISSPALYPTGLRPVSGFGEALDGKVEDRRRGFLFRVQCLRLDHQTCQRWTPPRNLGRRFSGFPSNAPARPRPPGAGPRPAPSQARRFDRPTPNSLPPLCPVDPSPSPPPRPGASPPSSMSSWLGPVTVPKRGRQRTDAQRPAPVVGMPGSGTLARCGW